MPTNVIMPALGVAQQTGTLLKWLKSEGQSVTKGEPLMEIETDKSTVEIEAAASGILSRVTAKAGDEVPVGQTIALILAPGEALPTQQGAPAAAPPLSSLPPGRGEGSSKSSKGATPRPPLPQRQLADEFSPRQKPSALPKNRESSWVRCVAAAPKEVF